MTNPDQNPDPSPQAPAVKRKAVWTRLIVAAGLLSLSFILYGMMGRTGKEAADKDTQIASDCLGSVPIRAALAPVVKGEIAAFALSPKPKPFTNLTFLAPDGSPKALSDFKGKWLLVNIWATWCVPCREEIPALDKLQASLGSDKFEVVTISIDTAKLDRRAAFFKDAGAKSLALYADPTANVFQILKREGKALGLPTTFLLDPKLCELGNMQGGADWASLDAFSFIKTALTGS